MVSSSPTSTISSIPPFSSKLAFFFSGSNVWRRIKENKNRQNGTGPNKQTNRQKMSQRKNTDRLTDTMFTHRNPIKNTKPERTCKVKRRKRRRKRKEKEPQENITRLKKLPKTTLSSFCVVHLPLSMGSALKSGLYTQ